MFVGTVSVEFWAWVFEAVASGVKSVVTIHFFIFICIWFIFNFLFVFIIITSSAEGLIQRRLKWKLGIGRYWVGLSFLWFLFRVFSKSGRATEVVGDSDSGFFFCFLCSNGAVRIWGIGTECIYFAHCSNRMHFDPILRKDWLRV